MIDLSLVTLPEPEFLAREVIESIESQEFELFNNAFDIMTAAGKSIASQISKITVKGSNLTFCLGPGNNGGDGYIAVSELNNDYDITIVKVDDPKTSLSKKAIQLIDLEKINLLEYNGNDEDILICFEKSDLIIDGIFGIGLSSTVRDPYDKLLGNFANFGDKIISIDLPSGLDCNRIHWWGPEFFPKQILTLGFTKKVMKDLDSSSDIIKLDIGFHRESIYLTNDNQIKSIWSPRKLNSHKGQNGRVLIIAGSDEFTGAPVLSGKAVLRSGVDTLRIAVPETIRDIVAGYNQDFIVIKVKGERHTSKSFKRFQNLAKNRHDVVVMGMGLSNHNDTKKFVREIVADLKDDVRIILDADAIRPYRDHLENLKEINAIITPHRAELRYLLKESFPTEIPELSDYLMECARKLNLIILLKGEIDIITDGKRILFNTSGTSSMTVGGTGDVLAGIVAAVNCFIGDKFYATAIASYIMGRAGEIATEEYGIGMIASDLVECIPKFLTNFDLM